MDCLECIFLLLYGLLTLFNKRISDKKKEPAVKRAAEGETRNIIFTQKNDTINPKAVKKNSNTED